MTKTWMGALLALGLSACGSDSPPGASMAINLTLAVSPLTGIQNVSLLRAGDSFTLAGYANGKVRWGRLSLDGVLTQETSFDLPQPARGPFFAATTKATPGDQLVALVVDSNPAGIYELSARVQNQGSAIAPAPVVLASFPVGVDVKSIQVAAGAATSGNAGFVAWGVQGAGSPVNYLLLSADATPSGAPGQAFGDAIPASGPVWQCLATTNGTTGLGFSVVQPFPGQALWKTMELNSTQSGVDFELIGDVDDCNIVGSPTPNGGYDIAFKNSVGINFSTYYPNIDPSQAGSVHTYPALATANFSGPLSVPHPVWVTSTGSDVSIGLAGSAGPEVVRFTYDAVPHGAALPLPSVRGQTGPVAAWVGTDAVYVTYADQIAASGTTQRYFIKVISPAKLP